MKYAYIKEASMRYNTTVLCEALGVSRSGYYDWVLRKPSKRELANQQLLDKSIKGVGA